MFESVPAEAVVTTDHASSVTIDNVSSVAAKFSIDMYPGLPDRYRLMSVLGEGAFSTVYKALDTKSNKTVAIKIINKTNLSAKQLKNIVNEVEIMRNMQYHPNILKLIESVSTPSHTYLVLEYSDGGEIFNKIIEYTYFSEPLCRHVFGQLLSAVDHLHRHNIVHRDIKPENLLFEHVEMFPRSHAEFKSQLRSSDDESKKDEGEFRAGVGAATIGRIKLADFGLAKRLVFQGLHHPLKTPCGTAGYTAPEVINVNSHHNQLKQESYSKSVDVWSLGCFLYTILCGFPPFYDEDHSSLTQRILCGDYVFLTPWWDDISDDVKDLISRMLVTNPEERISIEEIWNHRWMRGATRVVSDSHTESIDYFGSELSPEQSTARTPGVHDPQREIQVKHLFTPGRAQVPLQSPAAHAIKSVFDNPAMASTTHVQFTLGDPKCSSHKCRSQAMRSPFPEKFGKLPSFKDVFAQGIVLSDEEDEDDDDDDDDDDDEDTDDDDEIVPLTAFKSSHSGHSKVTLVAEDDEMSMDSNSDANTRSSSIISGVAGDFKFTLNLHDSNLLTRRRSSTMKKCLDPVAIPEFASKTVSH